MWLSFCDTEIYILGHLNFPLKVMDDHVPDVDTNGFSII